MEVLKKFAHTTALYTTDFNFFRGVNDNRTMIDLYDIIYKI